jgi:acyl carrier protein
MPHGTNCLLLILQVMAEVRAMLGHAVHPSEPLMAAGLDSRGAMELRRGLGRALAMTLPVTLLYDQQTVAAIVEYVNARVAASGAGGGAGGAEDGLEASPHHEQWGGHSGGAPDQPSELLKTLRCAQVDRQTDRQMDGQSGAHACQHTAVRGPSLGNARGPNAFAACSGPWT